MILDLIFPKSCLECKRIEKYICDDCFKKNSLFEYKDNNYAIFKYEGVIRKAVLALKYKFASDLVEELVDRMIPILKREKFYLNSFYLISIPLHKLRENWRGFNQANLVGKNLALKMDWNFEPNLLTRTRNTPAQVGLKGLNRHKNILGAFSVNSEIINKLEEKPIIVLDDVYTTGSTINEAKRVLLKAGLKNVSSLTIAR